MAAQYSLLFFQAEDGIRDRNVTGVQTCALPIYRRRPDRRPDRHVLAELLEDRPRSSRVWRSEERRVGKECRVRRPALHDKKCPQGLARVWRMMLRPRPHAVCTVVAIDPYSCRET